MAKIPCKFPASREISTQKRTPVCPRQRRKPHSRLIRLPEPSPHRKTPSKSPENRRQYNHKSVYFQILRWVAERQGFEPWRRSPAYTLSRRAPSTTRPPLRRGGLARGKTLLQEANSDVLQRSLMHVSITSLRAYHPCLCGSLRCARACAQNNWRRVDTVRHYCGCTHA